MDILFIDKYIVWYDSIALGVGGVILAIYTAILFAELTQIVIHVLYDEFEQPFIFHKGWSKVNVHDIHDLLSFSFFFVFLGILMAGLLWPIFLCYLLYLMYKVIRKGVPYKYKCKGGDDGV